MNSENGKSITTVDEESTNDVPFKRPLIIRPLSIKKKTKKNEAQSTQSSSVNTKPIEVSDEPERTSNTVDDISKDPGILMIHDENAQVSSNKTSSHHKLSPDIPYTEPSWKGMPDKSFYLEELKNGVIQREINISERSVTVIGRMEACHICLAHPSVSRYHAVLQYRLTPDDTNEPGFYLMDLDSTHGTFLNKLRIKPRIHQRIRVGHILKFGGSSRMLILQGPEDDMEEESEFTVTELKEMRMEKLRTRALEEEENVRKLLEAEELRKQEEEKLLERGVDWGMGEDADEESDLSENPYATLTNEESYRDDPRKELTKWMERHGEEIKFDIEQAERGKIVCRVTLPILDEKSHDVVIEASGRCKKEAISACALESCQHIDRLGLWKQAKQEAHKRAVRNWEENDFYDSDEDSFFDRTGELENKRKKRMKKAGKLLNEVETYESLVTKHEELVKELEMNENELARLTFLASKDSSDECKEGMDELDAFMENLKKEKPSKSELRYYQDRIKELRENEKRLIELINVAKPATIPNLKPAVIKPEIATGSHKERKNLAAPTNIDKPIKKKVECGEKSTYVDSRPRVLGPMLPPDLPNTNVAPKKKSRNNPRKQKLVPMEIKGDDYSNLMWVPPEGQTGDGRTSLNDKLGY